MPLARGMLWAMSNGRGWRKSSFCAAGECAEVRTWRVASSCNGGACVEVGGGEAVVGVRDNADPEGPVLVFSAQAWSRFSSSVKAS